MVFKGRFFSSKKSSDAASSPEGSNSPRSLGSNSSSPIRLEKKKLKSTTTTAAASASDQPIPPVSSHALSGLSSSFRQTQVKDGSKQQNRPHQQLQQNKKDLLKGKEPSTKTPVAKPSLGTASALVSASKSRKGAAAAAAEVPPASSVSPIVASSLGLKGIKTRSGPLPQESFFGFGRDSKVSAIGSSNLSKPVGGNGNVSSSSSKKRIGANAIENISTIGGWIDNGSNFNSMLTENVQTREQSPIVQSHSGLLHADPSSEAGIVPYIDVAVCDKL